MYHPKNSKRRKSVDEKKIQWKMVIGASVLFFIFYFSPSASKSIIHEAIGAI